MRIRESSSDFWILLIVLLVTIVVGIALIVIVTIDQQNSQTEYNQTMLPLGINSLVATYKEQTIIAKSATLTPSGDK